MQFRYEARALAADLAGLWVRGDSSEPATDARAAAGIPHPPGRVTVSALPKRPCRPRDPNELAHQMYLEAIGEAPSELEPEKNPAAVALGSSAGRREGKALVAVRGGAHGRVG